MSRKYTEAMLSEAVSNSSSIRQVLKKLLLKEAGGNYITIKHAIAKAGLNTSHFTGKGWNKGLYFRPISERPLSEILVTNSHYQSNKLRKRLLRENYFEAKCYRCGLRNWLGESIPLELEHIDGNRSNNCLTNLTLLCPNCHALTATWRRRKDKAELRSTTP